MLFPLLFRLEYLRHHENPFSHKKLINVGGKGVTSPIGLSLCAGPVWVGMINVPYFVLGNVRSKGTRRN